LRQYQIIFRNLMKRIAMFTKCWHLMMYQITRKPLNLFNEKCIFSIERVRNPGLRISVKPFPSHSDAERVRMPLVRVDHYFLLLEMPSHNWFYYQKNPLKRHCNSLHLYLLRKIYLRIIFALSSFARKK